MPFATRADLLARTNADRLAQLAVPADFEMPPADGLRAVIEASDLSAAMADYTQADQDALTKALDAIDKALDDADSLILSYGIPANVQTTLLARLCSTIAFYYLQGAERMTQEIEDAYTAAIGTLKAHARGELNLIPPDPAAPEITVGQVMIAANARRYIPQSGATADDW